MLVSMLVAAAQLLSAVASNVCDGSSLLQAASLEIAIVVPPVGPNRIPCVIHQIWNGTYEDIPAEVASWRYQKVGKEPRADGKIIYI